MHKQGLKASGFEMQWRTGPPNAGAEAKGQGSQKAVMRWRQVSHIPSSNAVAASGGVVVIQKSHVVSAADLLSAFPVRRSLLLPFSEGNLISC